MFRPGGTPKSSSDASCADLPGVPARRNEVINMGTSLSLSQSDCMTVIIGCNLVKRFGRLSEEETIDDRWRHKRCSHDSIVLCDDVVN